MIVQYDQRQEPWGYCVLDEVSAAFTTIEPQWEILPTLETQRALIKYIYTLLTFF